jgi:ATP-binding cassette, subfamily C, bacteriocin exporter
VRKRIPAVRQHGSNDCGVACLASVAAYYGRRLPLARLHHLAGTDRSGTNLLGLVRAAESLGFLAKGVRATPELLEQVALPAIAHVVVGGNQHYVAVYEAGPKRVVYMDPDAGEVRRVAPAEFAAIWDGVLVVLAPGERFQRGDETVSPARRLWGLMTPHRPVLLQALMGAVLYTLLGLATAVYVQKVIDHVFPSGNQNLLNLLSVGMVAVILLQLFVGTSQQFLLLEVGRRIDGQLILGYYDHLLGLPHRFFAGRRVGDVLARITDAARIRAFVSNVALRIAVNVLIVAFSVGLALLWAWKLALLLLALLPCYAAVYWITDRINRRNERAVMESSAELQAWLVESVESMSTVRHFGMEPYASLQTETRLVRLLRTLDRSARVAIGSGSASELLSRLAVVGVLWMGGGMVLRREVTPGELMSLYSLLAYLTGPVGALVAMNRDLRDAQIAAERLFEILDLPTDGEGEGERIELEAGDVGDLVFEKVTFRYGATPPVFRGLDMTIPAGRVTAVVGESGSGKSTLVALLHRTETVDEGRIRVGATDLAYLSAESLRRRIGVVPQRVELFSGTIASNVAVGELEPDMRRVLHLCDRLGITEFVEKLPRGFDAVVGENGLTLSGGQRQRIAVARALYRDPEVLVLDEATSSLDTVSERRIQEVLAEQAAGGKTVVLIAHRLSTVMHADKIIVLHAGAVVEEGTHRELLERRGAYYELWRQQFPAELESLVTEGQAPAAYLFR